MQIDLQDKVRLITLLDKVRPQMVVHFAAATNVDYCEANPSYAQELNVDTTHTLASWAAANQAKLIYMSTDSVFDGKTGGYSENSEPDPINVYAATKLEGEVAVRKTVADHLIVRANIYGWNGQPKQSLAEWILSRLELGQHVPGFVDTTFAPLLVNTLSSAIMQMMKLGTKGTYHAACIDPVTKFDFARAVARTFGHPESLVEQSHVGSALKAPRPLNTWLIAHRLTNELGIKMPSVAEDLNRFKALRDNGFVRKLKSSYSITT